MLITERNGVNRYHSVFFARRDSNIGSLEDLPGHSIAFQNSASTSAYFVPATELLERGLPMEILLSPMDRPAACSVGYLFARSELNISTRVDKRLVDAGVMSNLDWDNPRRMPPAYRASMKIIYKTGDYPRAVQAHRHVGVLGGVACGVVERDLREQDLLAALARHVLVFHRYVAEVARGQRVHVVAGGPGFEHEALEPGVVGIDGPLDAVAGQPRHVVISVLAQFL